MANLYPNPKTWVDDSEPDINAANLNNIEQGIDRIASAVISQIINDPDKIASMAALFSVNQRVDQLNSDLLYTDAYINAEAVVDSTGSYTTVIPLPGADIYNLSVVSAYLASTDITGYVSVRNIFKGGFSLDCQYEAARGKLIVVVVRAVRI